MQVMSYSTERRGVLALGTLRGEISLATLQGQFLTGVYRSPWHTRSQPSAVLYLV